MRELTLVFQHTDFYVMDKPAGAPMHANAQEPSVVHQLAEQLQEQLWPVHRLDTPTSGALLVARNAAAAAELSQLFAEREISKTYLAIAAGRPKKKQGWVVGDMDKARRGSWRLLHSTTNPARTYFSSQSLLPGYRYYTLHPSTGKTHQLRVALKSLGVPIVGDQRYGGEANPHLHLHAWQLAFAFRGEKIIAKAPLPSYGLFAELATKDALAN
ncbi:TIGR01621 family pseudouridine synthase [Pseudidiomarina sp. 1APR75-33.1]|uniref:TIGR01621 family pseudouridine synthase n=1 Tax=Pseudidiomarina terrestris TaxID=2820060 RepID=UPI00265140F1|nr:TIGR01621 family pseudouridine synthase [Pseudidiomarina sp. 1APR75-33.1]MDN7126013.1 TIGR01621 family pseudouridine synthase [Pseudidiomarina sp. 1APR75-33.1]